MVPKGITPTFDVNPDNPVNISNLPIGEDVPIPTVLPISLPDVFIFPDLSIEDVLLFPASVHHLRNNPLLPRLPDFRHGCLLKKH